MNDQRFNVRVYGIVINQHDELLISDELIQGIQFTKFPGGGLEWGEGTRACLQREFMEELRQEVEVLEHYYTTDYFQQSAFKDSDQLLSIYYKVSMLGALHFPTSSTPFDFPDDVGNQFEVQRWIHLSDLSPDDFKWPVDKIVAGMLRSEYLNE
ncbi:MAG: NUDIX domain-containing protein [Flavobacteriales bacterium]|nr:NUDIX domain-containing protein [Flavobacteriales bacterium]